LEEAEKLLADFDWSTVDARSDAEIVEAARRDTDASLPDDEELAEFSLVLPAKSRGKPPEAAE
jgi:hypothetical protein